MAEELSLPANADKASIYRSLLPQVRSLIEDEPDLTANLANIAAVLKEAFGFFWVGFYLAKEGELVLGPFQGPLACTRIKWGKGVCGTAAQEQKTILVPDVDQFPGHIACSSASRSEIVVPLVAGDSTQLVLDVDSDLLNDFDDTDAQNLESIVALIRECHFS